jgi:hypothetical protein
MMNIEQGISNHEGTATTKQQQPDPALRQGGGAKKRRRWWLIVLAGAAGLLLGWQAAGLAGRALGHGSGESGGTAVPAP